MQVAARTREIPMLSRRASRASSAAPDAAAASSQRTLTVAIMPSCRLQAYGNEPAFLNVLR